MTADDTKIDFRSPDRDTSAQVKSYVDANRDLHLYSRTNRNYSRKCSAENKIDELEGQLDEDVLDFAKLLMGDKADGYTEFSPEALSFRDLQDRYKRDLCSITRDEIYATASMLQRRLFGEPPTTPYSTEVALVRVESGDLNGYIHFATAEFNGHEVRLSADPERIEDHHSQFWVRVLRFDDESDEFEGEVTVSYTNAMETGEVVNFTIDEILDLLQSKDEQKSRLEDNWVQRVWLDEVQELLDYAGFSYEMEDLPALWLSLSVEEQDQVERAHGYLQDLQGRE